MNIIPAHQLYYNRLDSYQKKLVNDFFNKVEKILLPDDINHFEISSKLDPQLSSRDNRTKAYKLKTYFESLGYVVSVRPNNTDILIILPS